MTTQMTTRHPARTGHRTARSLPVVAGIGYPVTFAVTAAIVAVAVIPAVKASLSA